MNRHRFPIALRLFLTVLFTGIVIITISLGVFQWVMKENFSKYVADVEMQKLDHLSENLAGVYSIYHDWGNAIQAQMLQIEGTPDPNDFDHLSHMWLRRQYDIALQQRYFKENTLVNVPTGVEKQSRIKKEGLSEREIELVQQNLPSEYQPFEGLSFPLSSNREGLFGGSNKNNKEQDPNSQHKKRFIPLPDKLGLSDRLSLYDAQKHFIVGSAPVSGLSFRPIEVNHQIVGYLGLKPVVDEQDVLSINFFSNQQRALILIYAVTILASLILALLLAHYFKKPIHRLVQASLELTQGNYQYQVKDKRNDELGDLAKQINQLARILYQHEQSRRQWVADTSHELKTPLAVLQAQIEAMQDGIRKPTPEHLSAMMRQISSLKKLTQDLADLAQVEAEQLSCYFTEIDPWLVIVQEVENFQEKFAQAPLSVSLSGESTLLSLDIDRFKQIMVNLIGNSIRYTEPNGKVHIHTVQDDQHWTVYVDDSPFALSDEQLAHLGERFYRVDDSRTRSTGGTGLGLALSVKIAKILGGTLSFEHSPLGGLRAVLTFPKRSGNNT
ncbi:sensor histidine kinase efflux regulator BaeS [Acinetobacter sp. MD2(2019)]|uniref:sensor histidine kinase efflux regulator BaeS n=1 Tax=Acinetobacter sp. MD2(2019) TaxID=2605273 RepID=UPI002D1F6FC5|nr:sensor histidine kinase efflux regulator BaeS [Acinetobacter sp. MD2(2019)]MEB3754259.1 sensor histidine kinase efflux regulator BaeS [Acinetobacter sp. MD2(2019)]